MDFLSKKIRKYTSLITKCSYKTSLPNRWHYPIEIDTDQMYIYIYTFEQSKMAFIFQYTYASYYSSYHVQSASRQSSLKGTFLICNILSRSKRNFHLHKDETNKGKQYL